MYISNNPATYINAYLKNTGYSFAGTGKNRMGNTLTNMLRSESIKRTSYYNSLYDNFNDKYGINQNVSSGVNVDEKTLADSAKALKTSASALASGDVFKKNDKGEYDYDKIDSAVKGMVSDYNKTIKAFANSECVPALRQGVAMTETTSAYERVLGKVGVSINDDNTLSVDSNKLKNADMTLLKSLASGKYSFSSKVADRAQVINESAASSIGSTYNKSGMVSNYSNAVLAAILSLQV